MYYNEEYAWYQFKTLESIRKLPLHEQIWKYNEYLEQLSYLKKLNEIQQNTFQSFTSNSTGVAAGGELPTTVFSTTTTTTSTTTTTTTIPPLTDFISVWDTTKTNLDSTSTGNNKVQLPLVSDGTYNFVVNWGDGNTDTITSWNQAETLHTYASPGTYTISISGSIEGFATNMDAPTDCAKLMSILNWGPLKLKDLYFYFGFCNNLTLDSVADILDLSGITNFFGMFYGCSALTTINNAQYWNVSSITDMSSMFDSTLFNDVNIINWNVSNVTLMDNMFQLTPFNQDISNWNVSNVTSMVGMFNFASNFNQDLSGWCVTLIPDAPPSFDTGTTSWTLPRPVWGTCP